MREDSLRELRYRLLSFIRDSVDAGDFDNIKVNELEEPERRARGEVADRETTSIINYWRRWPNYNAFLDYQRNILDRAPEAYLRRYEIFMNQLTTGTIPYLIAGEFALGEATGFFLDEGRVVFVFPK